MKPEKLLLELEQLLEQCGYTLRKERGAFRGSDCIVQGDQLVIINKNKPSESQIGTIARVLMTVDLNDTYVKPAVRKHLEELWDRIAAHSESEDELEIE